MTAEKPALLAACLLTIAGGSMDACIYIGHGHVFANAQTGNVVLLAISLAAGQFGEAARHVPSIIAFAAGVAFVRLSESPLRARHIDADAFCLKLECAGLLAFALADGRLPDFWVTSSVSFMAALQITSVSQIGGWSFNSAMTTGNLRNAVSAASTGDTPRAIALGLICASFLLGAFAGGIGTMHLGDLSLCFTASLVALAAFITRA